MQWSERFATGNERLDRQHRRLFEMSEDYRSALAEGGGERVYYQLIASLEAYARGHFGIEEQCMEAYRCPVAEINHQAHTDFLASLDQYRQRYRTTGFTYEDAQSLVDFLDNWLADHIGRIDTQLRRCLPPDALDEMPSR